VNKSISDSRVLYAIMSVPQETNSVEFEMHASQIYYVVQLVPTFRNFLSASTSTHDKDLGLLLQIQALSIYVELKTRIVDIG
jgi:hypothetical protein